MFDKVYEAFLDYELILFRDVDLPPATQVAFARSFGEIQIHVMNQYQKYPEHPEIYMLTNADKDGKPTGKHPDKGTLHWHTDGSWRERTGQATMMYSEVVSAGRRRDRVRRHVCGLRQSLARDEEEDRGQARDPQSRLLAHAPPRRGPDDGGAEGEGAADRAPDRAHASRDRPQGDLPRRPRAGDRGHGLRRGPRADRGTERADHAAAIRSTPMCGRRASASCGTIAAPCTARPGSTRRTTCG